MKIGEFFLSLFSPDGEVSSKRLGGLLLLAVGMFGSCISYFNPEFSEVGESMAKISYYMGASLLGVNGLIDITKNTTRSVQLAKIEKKAKNEDK